MYTYNQFNRYAGNIEDLHKRSDFKMFVDLIQWEVFQGVKFCTFGAMAEVFKGSGLEELIADLSARIDEFTSEEEFKVLYPEVIS